MICVSVGNTPFVSLFASLKNSVPSESLFSLIISLTFFAVSFAMIVAFMDYSSDQFEGKRINSQVDSEIEVQDEIVKCHDVREFNRLVFLVMAIAVIQDATLFTFKGV